MTPEICERAIDCLTRGERSLIEIYTDTALLMNACDVTARQYVSRKDEFQLSTTQNIPNNARLPLEIDMVFHKLDLINIYREKSLQRLSEDFLIRMVSVIDAVFEDIYEKLLIIINPNLSENKISNLVRSAWVKNDNGQVKLVNFLLDDIGLQPPSGRVSKIDMVFDRYYEIREIRHALVHNSGVLSENNSKRLKALSERLPENLRDGSLANASFLSGNKITLTGNNILTLRHWAYTTIIDYFQCAFKESAKA
jgi:hypothetical protein